MISVPLIIDASEAVTDEYVDLHGLLLCGIHMPDTWTTANITFQGAPSQGASTGSTDEPDTFNDMYDASGTEVTVTAAASRYINLDPASYAGARFLKIRSGTTGTPVNQAAARTVVLELRPER